MYGSKKSFHPKVAKSPNCLLLFTERPLTHTVNHPTHWISIMPPNYRFIFIAEHTIYLSHTKHPIHVQSSQTVLSKELHNDRRCVIIRPTRVIIIALRTRPSMSQTTRKIMRYDSQLSIITSILILQHIATIHGSSLIRQPISFPLTPLTNGVRNSG